MHICKNTGRITVENINQNVESILSGWLLCGGVNDMIILYFFVGFVKCGGKITRNNLKLSFTLFEKNKKLFKMSKFVCFDVLL